MGCIKSINRQKKKKKKEREIIHHFVMAHTTPICSDGLILRYQDDSNFGFRCRGHAIYKHLQQSLTNFQMAKIAA